MFSYKKCHWTLFRGHQSFLGGRRAIRSDGRPTAGCVTELPAGYRKRTERPLNGRDNVFSHKKWVSNLFRGHQSISWGRRVIGSAGLTAGHRKRPMSEETSRTRKRPHKARFWIRGPLVCTKLHQRVSTKVPSQQNMSLTKNQFFQFRLGAYVGRNERNQNCRFLF